MNKVINVLIKPYNNPIFYKNNLFRLNNGHNYFYNYDKKMVKYGIILDTIDQEVSGEISAVVYLDLPYPWQIKDWLRLIFRRENNILFCFESPIIVPLDYLKIFHVFFHKIIAWNDDLVDNRKYLKMFVPIVGLPPENLNAKRDRFLTAVYSNKLTLSIFKFLSPYKNTLYEERNKAIRYFQKVLPKEFDLYGKGWNKPRKCNLADQIFGPEKFESYRGEIPDNQKVNAISRYKFCLAFENCIAPGYITEKIFDCFKARTVPIYWGAPNVEKYIPKECFIDMRDYQSYGDLRDYIVGMNTGKYNSYLSAINKFLSSKKNLQRWFGIEFDRLFLDVIASSKQNV